MRTLAPSSSFQAGSGTSSGPEGAWGHLPLLLLLEFLVGLIQVCKHLQQAGSCLSLLSWGIGTGPFHGTAGAFLCVCLWSWIHVGILQECHPEPVPP